MILLLSHETENTTITLTKVAGFPSESFGGAGAEGGVMEAHGPVLWHRARGGGCAR